MIAASCPSWFPLVLTALCLAACANAGEGPPAGNTASEVNVEKIPALTALCLPVVGSYGQTTAAITKLMMYAGPKGLSRGAPFGVYYSDPEEVAEDSLRWAICVPVAAGAKAEGPFQVKEFPEMEAASVLCTGPYEAAASCWGVLSTWLAGSAYHLAGAPQEHWLSDPQGVPPEKQQARILFPVVRKEPDPR